MAKGRRRNRYRLLLYSRVIGRLRIPSFLISLAFLGLWYGVTTQYLDWPSADKAALLFSSGLFTLGFWLYTWLGPILSFAQINDDHFCLQTPMYRLKIPYQYIYNTRPVEVKKISPPRCFPQANKACSNP